MSQNARYVIISLCDLLSISPFSVSRSTGTENDMEVSSLSPSTTSSEPRHFDEDDYLDRDLSEDKREGEEEEEDDIFSDECKPMPPPREESGTRRR